MGPKYRSIILLLVVFVMGSISGFFLRGIYDHQKIESSRRHMTNNQQRSGSRFVSFFTRVIKPNAQQKTEVNSILGKWDDRMKGLQVRFAQESQSGFQTMVNELSPLLDSKQMHELKEALEKFGPHRRYPRSSKKKNQYH